MNLTLNTYTQWYWKTDLHNLFHFLSLRADAHAQYEIRVYAEAMLRTVEAWVPVACQAFRDYRLGAVTLSAQMLAVVRRMLAGEAVEQAEQRAEPARVGGTDGGAGARELAKLPDAEDVDILPGRPSHERRTAATTVSSQPSAFC